MTILTESVLTSLFQELENPYEIRFFFRSQIYFSANDSEAEQRINIFKKILILNLGIKDMHFFIVTENIL